MRAGSARIAGVRMRRLGARLARLGLTVAGSVSVLAAVVAAATVWLCLTEPLTVADAVGRGELTAAFRVVTTLLMSALEQMVRYL